MAKLIGTAGHVDHGKTTLIHALTGIDADRLPEEKRRGMTIDIGFAYIDLPQVGRVSIVDVPGHERFLTNMLVGALGVDLALLCVAADEGVKPQTREHLQILDLLPVDRMLVVLTRSDLADGETRELAHLEVEELLDGTRFKGAPITLVSAVTGEGIQDLRSALSRILSTAARPRANEPWYLPVDRVFSVKGHGCVVTGTLAQGIVNQGDNAYLEPGHVPVRVRSIHNHEEEVRVSEQGKRTALNLSGVRMEDVRRGMAVGAASALFETTAFDAHLRWITAPKHGARVRVSIGAEEAIGKVFLSDVNADVAQFRLEVSVACALNQPVIIRRYSPPDVLGGGRVVVPIAKPRRKSQAVETAAAGNDEDSISALLQNKPNGVETEEICRLLGKTRQQLGSVFEHMAGVNKVKGFAGLWFDPAAFEEGQTRFMDALRELHAHSPALSGIPRDKVVSRAGLTWAGKPLDRILSEAQDLGILKVTGSTVTHHDFKLQLSPKQRAFLGRVIAALDGAGLNVPVPKDIARAVSAPPQAVDEILRLGVQAGEIIRIEDGVFYSSAQIEKLKEQVSAISNGKPFAASEFRDATGSSRRYVIPLLEYLDSISFTLRVGDKRVLK